MEGPINAKNAIRVQEALLDKITSQRQELVALCSELIQAPSENPPGDCSAVNDVLARFLDRYGVPYHRHTSPAGRENLVAQSKGQPVGKGRALILCGHTDVVPVGNPSEWSFPPFAGDVKDGFIRGRGASDMKGGLAGLAFVLALLNQFRDWLPATVTLAAVADEETGGAEGAEWILREGLVQGDACLIGEPSLPDYPTVGQKGSCWFEVHIRGSSAHGSLSPLAGQSAIVLGSKAVLALQRLWEMEAPALPGIGELIRRSSQHMEQERYAEVFRRVTVNVGTINGGTKVNMVPDSCTFQVDTRVPFGLTPEEVLARARELLEKEAGLAPEQFEVRPIGFQSRPNYTSPEEPVIQSLLAAIRSVRGSTPHGVLQWASSDARHFRAHGIPTVQYGPAWLPSIHGLDERVRVDDVVEAAKVYAMFVVNFVCSLN